MTTAAIILAVGLGGIAVFLLAAIVNALERIADELARGNALEQQRQQEDREHRGNVVQLRAGVPPDPAGGPRRPAPKRPGG